MNIEKAIEQIRKRHKLRMDGGPGSGNHGHEGVPGQRGGSAPSEGGGSGSSLEKEHTMTEREVDMLKSPQNGTKIFVLEKHSGSKSSVLSGGETFTWQDTDFVSDKTGDIYDPEKGDRVKIFTPEKSSSDTFTSDKNGAPSASEIGFDKNEYKKAEREWHEKNTGYFGSGAQQEVVDKITENLPRHVKTGNCDYEIDHYDYVGGHFSYKGTADGYTVGKEYKIPGKDGVTGKAVSIHVYPDGDGEVHFNYKDFGIRGNYTHHF